MLTDNRADYRTQDWFLVACDGDLVLKLASDLMIGEDERGQTVLSPAREDALLRITSEHGCLTLQAMAMNWTFAEDGGLSRQHLTFVEGLTLRLSFPSSTLILTPDFQASAATQVDREIRLMPTEAPALTLTRVDEPVRLIEQALLPAPEAANAEVLEPDDLLIEEALAQAEAAAALTAWDHQVPDEQTDRAPVPSEEAPVVASARPRPEPITESFPEPAVLFQEMPGVAATNPNAARRKHHWVLGGLLAATVLLAPTYLYLADGHKLGVDFPLSNYLPLPAASAAPATTATTAGPGATAAPAEGTPAIGQPDPTGSPTLPEVADAGAAQDQRAAAAQPEPSAAEVRQQLLIDSLLAEAKAYYNAGLIVSPVESNTVSHLTQVLNMDPTNEEGLQLMYLSAVTLIREAEAAHAAGNDYLARNLVEDVLGFHPEFDDARALLDSWARVPEG